MDFKIARANAPFTNSSRINLLIWLLQQNQNLRFDLDVPNKLLVFIQSHSFSFFIFTFFLQPRGEGGGMTLLIFKLILTFFKVLGNGRECSQNVEIDTNVWNLKK